MWVKKDRFKVLGLGVLVAGLVAGLVLVRQVQDIRERAAAARTASLAFSVTQLKVVPGNVYPVGVTLATGGQSIVGADVLVRFDQSRLALESISGSGNSGFSNIFRTYAPIRDDCTFDTGRVVVEANARGVTEFGVAAFDPQGTGCDPNNPSEAGRVTGAFNGSATAATLTFAVRPGTGASQVRFIPSSGVTDAGYSLTTDSNVVLGGAAPEDILQTPGSIVTVNYCYDFAGGGTVNVGDIQAVAAAYAYTPGTIDTKYQARFDLNNNGRIDIGDIQPIAAQYLNSCI